MDCNLFFEFQQILFNFNVFSRLLLDDTLFEGFSGKKFLKQGPKVKKWAGNDTYPV